MQRLGPNLIRRSATGWKPGRDKKKNRPQIATDYNSNELKLKDEKDFAA